MPRKKRFSLAVKPSIFKDGTFGVYAIPEENSELEYQLDGCFSSVGDAQAVSEAYLKLGRDRFVSDSIEVSQSREVRLNGSAAGLTEENQV